MSGDEDDIADVLRRVLEEARGAARAAGPEPAGDGEPGASETGASAGQPLAAQQGDPCAPPPSLPDGRAVNQAWAAEASAPRGLAGLVYRVLDRTLRPRFEAQRTFNAHQVRFDNDTLRHLEERFAHTHQHYDRLLGLLGRRLDEVDQRHALLERELLRHVRALARRIDLVLTETSRGRAGLDFALDDLRARLARLEEALRRRR